jgi:hypothetical protein
MNYFTSLCTCSILLLSSCKNIEPIVPENEVAATPTLVQRTSNLALPIELNLEPYFKDIEKSIPKQFKGKEDKCSGVSYSYRFERDPIRFNGKGQYIEYEVFGKYALNLNYCAECTYMINSSGNCVVPRIYASCGVGESMRRASVAYTTKIQVASNLQLKSDTKLSRFETIDPCEITVFNYDATDKLKKEVTAELKKLEEEIDKTISEVDIRSKIKEVWKTLATPQQIGHYGYLSLQPKEVSVSDINFVQKKAFLNVNMLFQPQITSQIPATKVSELPKLSEYKTTNGFNISLDIQANYDSLSSILNKELKGKQVMIKKNLVIFDSMEVQGALNNKLNLKVAFSGKRKGTLFLVGTPVFDSVQQIITFPDLTFDLNTKNALLKSAKWLFNSKITDKLQEFAVFDLKPHLIEVKKSIEKELNREISLGIHLKGSINDVSVGKIYPTDSQLLIRVHADGKMSVKM